MMLGYNVAVPPYVPPGAVFRIVDNDDVLAKIRKPRTDHAWEAGRGG
jgi:hypothetical protein